MSHPWCCCWSRQECVCGWWSWSSGVRQICRCFLPGWQGAGWMLPCYDQSLWQQKQHECHFSGGWSIRLHCFWWECIPTYSFWCVGMSAFQKKNPCWHGWVKVCLLSSAWCWFDLLRWGLERRMVGIKKKFQSETEWFVAAIKKLTHFVFYMWWWWRNVWVMLER